MYTQYRVLHGAKNSGSCFQSAIESILWHLDLLIYIDDLLGCAKNPKDLLKKIRHVFTICHEKGLQMHPAKCEFVTFQVYFCGRIINKSGVKFNPRQYEALNNMSPPTTVGALVELVHDPNWMRTAISKFSKLVTPLHELLEKN